MCTYSCEDTPKETKVCQMDRQTQIDVPNVAYSGVSKLIEDDTWSNGKKVNR